MPAISTVGFSGNQTNLGSERHQQTHHFPPMRRSPDPTPEGAYTPGKGSGAAMYIEAFIA